MSSSPFNFPHGDGRQVLHDMSVQSRRAEKEIPASVLDSLLPLVPERSKVTQGGWTCPAGLGVDPWRSPTVTAEMPNGRKIGFQTIDVTGQSDLFDLYKQSAPDMRLVVNGEEYPGYSPAAFSQGGSTVQYSYRTSMSTSTDGAVSVYAIFRNIGAGYPQSTPSVAVHGISIKISSIWF